MGWPDPKQIPSYPHLSWFVRGIRGEWQRLEHGRKLAWLLKISPGSGRREFEIEHSKQGHEPGHPEPANFINRRSRQPVSFPGWAEEKGGGLSRSFPVDFPGGLGIGFRPRGRIGKTFPCRRR